MIPVSPVMLVLSLVSLGPTMLYTTQLIELNLVEVFFGIITAKRYDADPPPRHP